MNIKTGYAFLAVALLVGVSGCKRKQKAEPVTRKPVEVRSEVDIPFADENIRSFFDDDINEFSLEETYETKGSDDLTMLDQQGSIPQADDFAFVDETKDEMKVVYFDFDSYSVRDDQEAALACNIEQVKKMLAENPNTYIVVDGHSCHAAGSRVYNMALSEKRAKSIGDRLAAAGVAKDRIKVVGRGAEMPAIMEGKLVSGDRVQQWPNRRDEMHVIS